MVEGLKVGRLRPDGSLPGQPHGPVGEQSDELSSEAGQPEQKIFILVLLLTLLWIVLEA